MELRMEEAAWFKAECDGSDGSDGNDGENGGFDNNGGGNNVNGGSNSGSPLKRAFIAQKGDCNLLIS